MIADLGLATLERLRTERLGPPSRRIAELAGEEADDGLGDVERRGIVGERGGIGADSHEVQREVADDLGRRRHLDDVAEDVVGGGVHVLDLLELLAEPEGDGLLAEVGELTAGDLVAIDTAGRCRQPGLERCVEAADAFPVGLERVDRVDVEAGLARRVVGGGDQRGHRGLAGGAGQCCGGDVDRVDARVDRGEQCGELAAGGVVGVQVHRQVEALSQGGDERTSGGRTQQSCHVLDREHVRAGLDDPVGELEVVVERVELLGRVGQVAGVAERDLGDRRAGLAYGLDRRAHLVDVVERVEDAEDVDAGLGGLLDERVGDLGRVGRVAHGVASTQQHLQADVGRRLAHRREPLPRVLLEEPQRHVIRRTAPRLDRQQLRRHARDMRSDASRGHACVRGSPAVTGARHGTSCR